MSNSSGQKSYVGAFITVTSLFFLWGFLTVFVDSLIPRLREVFELSYFESGLVQFAFFMAYFFLSIPAGQLLPRLGYKKGVILGLGIMGIGCLLFWPAAGYRIFGLFLAGYFILAGGMTVLQVAANPYVAVLGKPSGAAARLNLAQAFNSVGTTLAPILGALFILSDTIKDSDAIAALSAAERTAYFAAEASAVQLPFLVAALAILALAGVLIFIKLPQVIDTQVQGSYAAVFKNRKLVLGALGILVYVGSEVAIGSYLVNYFLDMNLAEVIRNNSFMSWIAEHTHSDLSKVDGKGIVGTFVAFYWGGAMLGRFVGAGLTALFPPGRVLTVFGALAITMLLISMSTTGLVAMWTILAVGLFNSIMFPTIFTLAISDLGIHKPQGSGVLCTAIVGGAIISPLFGKFYDLAGFKVAIILLILCYAFIGFYGYFTRKSLAHDAQ
ncbi:MAG: sugar MFS transporter [Salibacteraceae bacterium]